MTDKHLRKHIRIGPLDVVAPINMEGITLNEVEQNLYAIEDQEQDFVVISPSKPIAIDKKL